MDRTRLSSVLAALLGALLLVVAVVYLVEPAHSLPGFFPGHVGRGSAEYGHHHVKHAIAAFGVGLAAFAFAWFASGPAGRARGASDSIR